MTGRCRERKTGGRLSLSGTSNELVGPLLLISFEYILLWARSMVVSLFAPYSLFLKAHYFTLAVCVEVRVDPVSGLAP